MKVAAGTGVLIISKPIKIVRTIYIFVMYNNNKQHVARPSVDRASSPFCNEFCFELSKIFFFLSKISSVI